MRLVRMAAWVALLVIGSIAAAGLVVTLDHPASGGARPELTARDGSVLAPRLDALTPSLQGMAAAAAELSGAARDTLVALRAGDGAALPASLDDGDRALGRLSAASRDVRTAVPHLLDGLGDGSRLAATDRARVDAVGSAVAAVDTMGSAWDAVGAASLVPGALVLALADHDAAVDIATAAGRAERYPDALAALDRAGVALADAGAARDRAVDAGESTPELDGLLAGLADRDTALRALYDQLAAIGSVRTPEIDAALAAVDATQAALGDVASTRAIAVAEAGAAGITASLLVLEDGRGAIAAALGGS